MRSHERLDESNEYAQSFEVRRSLGSHERACAQASFAFYNTRHLPLQSDSTKRKFETAGIVIQRKFTKLKYTRGCEIIQKKN